MKRFAISSNESHQTLEKFVRKVLKEAPTSFIYKLFRKKDVKVNGHWEDKKYLLSEGEEVSIYITDEQFDEFKKEHEIKNNVKISSWIIYEDDNLLIINKPRGVLVQKKEKEDIALDDMVIAYLNNQGSLGFTPAPIHRLDRNTAGIVLFGKNITTIQYFSSVINDKEKIVKKYFALVKGEIDQEGDIIAPLSKRKDTVFIDYQNGKPAHTKYSLIERLTNYSLIEVQLLTGRTHQIRVHLSSISHPILGDSKYGDFDLNKMLENNFHFKNQFLIARTVSFHNLDEPFSYLNEKEFIAKMPDEFLNLLHDLRK